MRINLAAALIGMLVLLGNSSSRAQSVPPFRWQFRPTMPPAQAEVPASPRYRSGRLSDLAARGSGQVQSNSSFRGRVKDGTSQEIREFKHQNPPPGSNTIPFWTDSFSYRGFEYKYSMVGSDPRISSRTTVIPTMIIPLRFVFPDGQVFDASTDISDGGQTAVNGAINSPIFQNYNFVLNGTAVGNTQYGDAFQRANFWDSVSTRSRSYHVLLGQPTVAPTQTINVPAGQGTYLLDPTTGQLEPVVTGRFLGSITDTVLAQAGATPDMLPIILWGRVTGFNVGGFHGSHTVNGNPNQTFISTAYGGPAIDSYVLSHEVVEWMDDPFVNNFSAGWNFPFISPIDRCDSDGIANDVLEVADPVEFFIPEAVIPLNTSTFTYHVTEAVFIDFFTRSNRSRSVNGQYSMFTIGAPFGLASLPSSDCTGHVETTDTFVDFPGASFTVPFGINNSGDVVGYFGDQAGQIHGFIRRAGGGLAQIDIAGAAATAAYKINEAGDIVGEFDEPNGIPHGFLLSKGKLTRIDYPGSSDSVAFGVNAAGDIVGAYDLLQPVTHGFLYRNGKYERIDAPFASQTAVQAINSSGVMAGNSYDDPAGFTTGFLGRKGAFSSFAFPQALQTVPTSINGGGDLAGYFADPGGGGPTGFATFNGFPYELYSLVFGNNDRAQVVGYKFIRTGAGIEEHGFIGNLPTKANVK